MKKNLFLKVFLFTVIATLVTFTSCKDYDDDISSLESQIAGLSSTLNDLKSQIDAGAVITDVKSTADGVTVTLSDGKTFNLTNGKDGVQGPKGDAGAAGEQGPQGEPGSVITIGDNGNWFIDEVDTGKSAQGAQGETGAPGKDGETGPQGPQGPQGETGAPGKDGETGPQGPQGETGAPGKDGETGPQGPQGETGAPGKDGVYYVPNADGYWYKHDGDVVTKENLWLLPGVITAVINDFGDVTFHNVNSGDATHAITFYNNKLLRSLVLVPHYYVNGIEAIGFNPLKYLCKGTDNSFLANPNYVTVKYHVNPSSITEDMIDVDNLSFVYRLQEHKTRSADINAKAEFVSLNNGMLTVRVDLDANKGEKGSIFTGSETMDMLALQVPLSEKAKKGYTNFDAIITSDWARVDVEPMTDSAIDRIGHLCAKDALSYSGNYNTVTKAKAETDPYLLELVYDQEHNLLDYVTSTGVLDGCREFDPSKYGLVWNFDLLDENNKVIKYVLTSNDTEQQEFINLLGNQGKVEAKVYDATPGSGVTDAIGRTPIVRVQLIDPATKCVVQEGFVKIKWVKEQPVFDAEYPMENVDFSCDMVGDTANYYSSMGLDIKTKWMNVNVMNAMGTYYQEFIHNYTLDATGLYAMNGDMLTGNDAWGVVVPNPDAQEGEPEVTDLFSVHLNSTCDVTKATTFTGYVHYTNAVSGEVALRIKVTLKVNMPNLTVAGHNNTYWQGGNNSSNVFNVNPVQFATNPQVNPTANYRTDLLNGFTNGTTYTDDINKIVKSSIAGHEACDVEFVFDKEALKTYTFVIDGVTYRSTGTNPNLQVSANGKNLEFRVGTTWNIGSYISKLTPMPGLANGGEAIHLNESGQDANAVGDSWPTKFAKALVGKKVPVKLAAKLCCDTECDLSRDIRKFEVYFIPPMHINSTLTDSFEDWITGGDYIKLDKAFTLTDFAKYLVSEAPDDNTLLNEKHRWTKSLWDYYEIHDVVWDVSNATSNIGNVGGDLDVVPGANNPLPTNYEVTYVPDTDADNPNSLRFQNQSGAPLAKEFELYVPVTVGHKWGTLSTTVTIKVLPPQ